MGLFDKMKKQKEFNKKAEWKQGLIPTIVELNEDHIKLTGPASTDIVFYKDIMNLECVGMNVRIKTNVKTFSLVSEGLRGRSERARVLQEQILEKMMEYKNQ